MRVSELQCCFFPFLLAFCLLGGCASTGTGPSDAGPDAADEETTDTGDGGPGDDGGPDVASGDLAPTQLPLGPAAVIRIGNLAGVDIGSAAFIDPAGELQVVWEHFDGAFTRARLLQSQSADGAAWSVPVEVALGSRAFRASPSILNRDGASWIYFVDTASLDGAPVLVRAAWQETDWGTGSELAAVTGLSSLLSWPRFSALADGKVAVVFRDGSGRARLATSVDGSTFESEQPIGTDSVAMVALGQFGSGALACTYQIGYGGAMVSWVRLSPDGTNWSEPILVSGSSGNVHDTTLVPRRDGDLDLYFIYPCGGAGFCLFRRSLVSSGALGPEEQVTSAEVFEPSKPEGFRLPDGRLLVLWAAITQRDAGGNPIEQVLYGVIVTGDAPL